MELHKDSGKPTLPFREIEEPFSTQRLSIISSVPFSLKSARKEYFSPKKDSPGSENARGEERNKRVIFCARGFNNAI